MEFNAAPPSTIGTSVQLLSQPKKIWMVVPQHQRTRTADNIQLLLPTNGQKPVCDPISSLSLNIILEIREKILTIMKRKLPQGQLKSLERDAIKKELSSLKLNEMKNDGEGITIDLSNEEEPPLKKKKAIPSILILQPEAIFEDIAKLLDNKEKSDIIFEVGPDQERIYAHLFVLIGRYPHFKEILKTKDVYLIEDKKFVSFPEWNPKAFKLLLKYFYTNKLTVDPESVFQFFLLSSELRLNNLNNMILVHFKEYLSINNVMSLATDAYLLNQQGSLLADAIFQYIWMHSIQIFTSLDLKTNFLPEELLVRLIEGDHLVIELDPSKNEYEICLLASQWLNIYREKYNKENLKAKEALQNAIRFHLIKDRELIYLKRCSKGLFDGVELEMQQTWQIVDSDLRGPRKQLTDQ